MRRKSWPRLKNTSRFVYKETSQSTSTYIQSWTKAAEEISPRFEDVRHFSEITIERKAAERSIEEKKKL